MTLNPYLAEAWTELLPGQPTPGSDTSFEEGIVQAIRKKKMAAASGSGAGPSKEKGKERPTTQLYADLWALFPADARGSAMPGTGPEFASELEALLTREGARPTPDDERTDCNHRRELALALRRPTSTRWTVLWPIVAFIARMVEGTSGSPFTGTVTSGCTHPREIAALIRRPTNFTWDELLREVERLYREYLRRVDLNHEPEARLDTPWVEERPVQAGSARLFDTTTPLPEFQDPTKASTYVLNLEFWAKSQAVKPENLERAVYAILSGWKGGRLADYAKVANAANLVRLDWESTVRAVTTWVQDAFTSATAYSEAWKKWENLPEYLKGRDYISGGAFFLAFEAELMAFQRACQYANIPEPSTGEVTRRMMSCLPEQIRLHLRCDQPSIDGLRWDTFKEAIERKWKLVNTTRPQAKQAAAEVYLKRAQPDEDDLSEDEGEARTAKRPFIPFGNKSTKEPCRKSWERAPKNFQGPISVQEWMTPIEAKEIRARWERVKMAGVCARCRMPRSVGHILDTFMPVGAFEIARARMAQEADEDLQEDVARQD